MKAKEVVLGEFDKTQRDEYGDCQAWSIAFVYAPEGNFVIKGMASKVKSYIKRHFIKCVVNYTWWKNGRSRNFWRSSENFSLYISHKRVGDRLCYVIEAATKDSGQHVEKLLVLRRMPRKWIDVYDKAMPRSRRRF